MKNYEKKPETATAICWGDENCDADLGAALNPDQIRVSGTDVDVAYEGGWRRLALGEFVIVARSQAQLVLSADDFNAQWREIA